MKLWLVSVLPLALAACAADGDDATGDDDVTAAAAKVSGYDLAGPKALASNKSGSTFCVDSISPERAACDKVKGTTLRANDCKELCTKPIAPVGKGAGYDFSGYKQVANDKIAQTACIEILSAEQAACERVEGETSSVNDCKVLCSKPIAQRGQLAGFDQAGFKVLPANDVAQICPAVVSAVKIACGKVKGTTARADHCKELCSLPL